MSKSPTSGIPARNWVPSSADKLRAGSLGPPEKTRGVGISIFYAYELSYFPGVILSGSALQAEWRIWRGSKRSLCFCIVIRPQDSDIPLLDDRIIVTFAPHSLSNDEMFTIMPAIDNVIWEALTTRQVEFCESLGSARRFAREVTLLSAIDKSSADGYDALGSLVGENNTAAVFLNAPYEEQRGWTWIAGAPLLQMICEDDRPARQAETSRPKMVRLGLPDSAEMIELTTLTKPGPFGPRTHELGNYMGIREGGKLAAMAGERLKVPGFTEVSAVCTHPDFLGRGYAGVLMKEIMRGIWERGETPFLHVRGDNTRAIALYERLGFRIRHRGHFAVLRRETKAKAS